MADTQSIHLRIGVIDPPAGVRFCLQKGRAQCHQEVLSQGTELLFECQVKVAGAPQAAAPNFLGPFAQGTPRERFVYLRSGQMAGQMELGWSRRAKIFLTGIEWPLVDQVAGREERCLEIAIAGTARDGGPVAAGVRRPVTDWHVGHRG